MDRGAILAGCYILVVEDDYFIMDDLRQGLEGQGATILGPVGNVADALHLAAVEQRIDAAVLDINLHGEMAFPVIECLRGRGVPIVFTTGYDREILSAADARAIPREIHCEKPVEPEAVARAVAACTTDAEGHGCAGAPVRAPEAALAHGAL